MTNLLAPALAGVAAVFALAYGWTRREYKKLKADFDRLRARL